MEHPNLSCQELVELVTNYLEAALPDADRARFEAHLAECRGCRSYIQQMQETIRLVGKLHEETIPPEAKTTLLEVFQHWKNGNDTPNLK